jgi:hypothetical protein
VAEEPTVTLSFGGGCPDCGQRTAVLPAELPHVGDDFDWSVRDYDGFRTLMLEELTAAFPERSRWTSADLEVVIVEALAAALDQLSDMLDRITAEAYLETARRPQSVRRLLHFIGYDPEREADLTTPELLADWKRNPTNMEAARRAGPRAVQEEHRMVTASDYGAMIEAHPVVSRATAWAQWGGAWSTMRIATIAWDELTKLDDVGVAWSALAPAIADFNERHGVEGVPLTAATSMRAVLAPYLDRFRMAGQEAVLEDAGVVPIAMSISVQVGSDYFQSEVRDEVRARLFAFFAPGQLRFGQNVYESDIVKLLTAIEGVEDACLNRFKRLGSQYPDDTAAGVLAIGNVEIASCVNDPADPGRGYYRLALHGGRRG